MTWAIDFFFVAVVLLVAFGLGWLLRGLCGSRPARAARVVLGRPRKIKEE